MKENLSEIKSVVLIGSGNVAWHLGQRICDTGILVDQVINRTEKTGREMASRLKSVFTGDIKHITKGTGLIIIAVNDDSLEGVLKNLDAEDTFVVHTAGSIGMDVFGKRFRKYGVLYPLQTFTKSREMDFKKVPLFIEANNSENLINLEKFSGRLSDRVAVLSSGQRMYLHLAGVMASNFTNHFMAIAEKIMKDHGMDFLLFRSLMEETIDKAFSKGPQEAQTGPAIRGDQKIIAKHTDLLDQYPEFRELYVKISGSIASIRAWQ